MGGTGREARRWGNEAMDLARRVKALRVGVESPLNVNVVYQVGGDVVPVGFSGVRAGRYSSADKLLLVQAAVREAAEHHSEEDPGRTARFGDSGGGAFRARVAPDLLLAASSSRDGARTDSSAQKPSVRLPGHAFGGSHDTARDCWVTDI